ncbi:diguanylate cyclase [Tundrisphaera lichenicola]|uniref:diguanylate cyclase n=1 Tax=Tundrisphaera lichenicola TaxID=2029860 RepID=UPI003EC01739
MDDNGATHLCDLLAGSGQAGSSSSSSSQHPMYLIVLSGGIPGAMLRLSAGGSRLGRSADNTIQLPDSSISRYHAYLGTDDEGQVRLTDLGSTNGTFLNGQRLPENTPVRVDDGDRLQIGANVILKFIRPDPCEEKFQREMFERTVRDQLTGLYNRAFFLSQFGPLADRGSLRGLGTAVLMLDIDHFKRINDTHGHEVGDIVLREVAVVLRQATRTDDLVARYGGEEFVVALPVAAPDQATERAERVRSTLASRRILAGGVPLGVTASLGLAFTPPGRPRSISALIATADRGLYQAKNAGRDRTVFSHDLVNRPVESATTVDDS